LGSGASKKWSLINNTDTTNPITLLSNELDFGGSPFHLMFDGFDVKVFDAPSAGLRNAQLTAPTNAAIFQTVDPSGQFQLFNDGTQLDDFTTSLTGLDAKYELRFTDNGSIARVKMSVEDTVGVWKRVPFEAWMVDSAGVNINRQVFVAYYDLNGDGIWNSTSNPFHGDYRMFDSIIGISKYIYRDTTHPTLQGVAGTLTKRGMLKAVNQRIKHLVFTDVNGGPTSGTTIQFETKRAIHNGDVKRFIPKPVTRGNLNLMKNVSHDITAVPNPYYGLNVDELDRYQRFIKFHHLPEHATIRIFDLAGGLVKVIDKYDATQFAQWDLTNMQNLPVASGIYIAHIEMKEIGETKILKLMIVQEQQFLQNY